MSELPVCRHRGEICETKQTVKCASNRWLHRGTVPLSLCVGCRYADTENVDLVAMRAEMNLPPVEPKPKGLGDRVEQALTAIGITKERVEEWVGPECGCEERKQKLNRIGEVVSRFWGGLFGGGKAEAAKEIEEMISHV